MSTKRVIVKVPDRDDPGVVVMQGKNLGTMYCWVLLFPATGEVKFYDVDRVTVLEQ